MTITAKPSCRTISEWNEIGLAELITDDTVYESQPTSWVNPTLSIGTSAGGETAVMFATGIGCDYKWSGGDGAGDAMGMFAMPEGGSYPGDAIFLVSEFGAPAVDWTHAHEDLTPGMYWFGIGVNQHGTTPIYGWFDNIEISPSIVLTSIESSHFAGESNEVPTAEITITPWSFYFGSGFAEIPTESLLLAGRNPSGIWQISRDKNATAQAIFKCVLTGAPDGLDDIEIPIASFQSRMRDGDPSYLTCSIKNSLEYSDEVAARTNGEIVIYKGYRFADGTEQLEEINRVDYEHCMIDRGTNSDTMSIVGHKTTSSSSPKDWTVSNVSFYGLQADGKRRIRADMDLFLRVGDTCIYGEGGNDYFVVGMITYWAVAIPATLFMEVLEA